MLFNSYIFVLLFLPVCVAGYFLLNHFHLKMLGQLFLLGMSLWFYGYFNPWYLIIIVVSILINYAFYLLLGRTEKPGWRKWMLAAAVVLNIGILFYFKYYDFFMENLNAVFGSHIALKQILLPLGISFFTFQQLSFVIDTYRREVPQYDFIRYASFVTFFPQLVAGPIVTHDELIPQFIDDARKKMDWENFSKGLYIFALGLGKKVLLADTFGAAVNWGFANIAGLDSTNAIITTLAYTVQIYFDFSGYCDMAIGLGKMLNIDLPVNFNSPYKSLTITEFWERWHMTLTRFFTRYVYVPLGGSRKGSIRTYVNILIVFLVSGLWHGANWTFVLWGACHGVFSMITRRFKAFFDKLHPALNWLITFSFVNLTWIIFRADTIADAGLMMRQIFRMEFHGINKHLLECFELDELAFLVRRIPHVNILGQYPALLMSLFFLTALVLLLGSGNAHEKMQRFKPTTGRLIVTALLLVWCICSFAGVSTFLYFNF